MNLRKLIYYSALYGGSAAALKILGFVIFLWLARTLPIDRYAQFGLYYALQTGLSTFAIAGIFEVVVGRLQTSTEPKARARIYGLANTSFLILGATSAFVACSGHAILTLEEPAAEPGTFYYAALSGLALALATLQQHIMRLEERHDRALLFGSFVPGIGLAAGFAYFFLERSLSSFFLGLALGEIAALLLLRLGRAGSFQHCFDTDEIRLFFRNAPPFILIAVFGWLGGYGNNYLIQGLLNTPEVAKFTFALSITSAVQLVANALNQVWSPRFFRLSRDLPFADVERQNRLAFRWLAVSLGLAGAALLVLVPPALDMIGGNLSIYRSMQFELMLMVLAYVVFTPWWHCNNYYLVHGMGPKLMKITLVTSIVGTAIWIVLMVLIGAAGVYLGFFVMMAVRSIGAIYETRKNWPITIAWEGVAAGVLITGAGYLISTHV